MYRTYLKLQAKIYNFYTTKNSPFLLLFYHPVEEVIALVMIDNAWIMHGSIMHYRHCRVHNKCTKVFHSHKLKLSKGEECTDAWNHAAQMYGSILHH